MINVKSSSRCRRVTNVGIVNNAHSICAGDALGNSMETNKETRWVEWPTSTICLCHTINSTGTNTGSSMGNNTDSNTGREMESILTKSEILLLSSYNEIIYYLMDKSEQPTNKLQVKKQPIGKQQSFDMEVHPQQYLKSQIVTNSPNPVVVVMDFTGSMADWSSTVMLKIKMLYGLLSISGYVKDL